MFAVREEVEVLKEKIAELMDRINQLEVENTILKANASQETLSQLSMSVVSVQKSPNPQSSAANVANNNNNTISNSANNNMNNNASSTGGGGGGVGGGGVGAPGGANPTNNSNNNNGPGV